MPIVRLTRSDGYAVMITRVAIAAEIGISVGNPRLTVHLDNMGHLCALRWAEAHCHKDVRIEYDADIDAAYVYFNTRTENSVKTTEIKDGLIVDLNGDGRAIGLEVLNASKHFDKDLLVEKD